MSSEQDNEEKELKVILLGECGVGKTNIILRYLKDEFNEDTITTTNSTYTMKTVKKDDTTYRLNVWDTAGQEKFRSITKMFLQDASIIMLVYSITDKLSFKNLEFWYKTIIENCGTDIVIAIVGNKHDLYLDQEVDEEEAKNFAENKNAIFKVVSAKEGRVTIDQLFELALDKYIEKNGNKNGGRRRNSLIIDGNKNSNTKIKKKFC